MDIIIIVSIVIFVLLAALGAAIFLYNKLTYVVREDTTAVIVNRDGFYKRILSPGRHRLLRPFEGIEFTLETKTKSIQPPPQTLSIATSDGILVDINWSVTYVLQPDLITKNTEKEKTGQRLRSLQNTEKPIIRHTDVLLRELVGSSEIKDIVGSYEIKDLVNSSEIKPTKRKEIENQLNEKLAERLKPMGIVLKSLYLHTIEVPEDVTRANNKAKAIEIINNAIRGVDEITRKIVKEAQLEEVNLKLQRKANGTSSSLHLM